MGGKPSKGTPKDRRLKVNRAAPGVKSITTRKGPFPGARPPISKPKG